MCMVMHTRPQHPRISYLHGYLRLSSLMMRMIHSPLYSWRHGSPRGHSPPVRAKRPPFRTRLCRKKTFYHYNEFNRFITKSNNNVLFHEHVAPTTSAADRYAGCYAGRRGLPVPRTSCLRSPSHNTTPFYFSPCPHLSPPREDRRDLRCELR